MAKQKQTTAPQATIAKKKLTLNEFRAWLSGVEEMQDESWTPSPSQWQTIRAKIEEVIEPSVQQRRFVGEDDGNYERPQGPIRAQGPSAFSAPQPMAASGPAPVPGADGKIRTPNIDTSGKPYVSSLE